MDKKRVNCVPKEGELWTKQKFDIHSKLPIIIDKFNFCQYVNPVYVKQGQFSTDRHQEE